MSSEEKYNWIKQQLMKEFKEAVGKTIGKRNSRYPFIVSRNGMIAVVKPERS